MAEAGDPAAAAAVAKAGRALGEAATAIAEVIDPDVIVMGGPVGVHPLLVEQVQRTLDDLAAASMPVLTSELGDLGPLEGALHLASATLGSFSSRPGSRRPHRQGPLAMDERPFARVAGEGFEPS
ncbi:ROK family protein [Nostocoides australiense]